MTRHLLLLRNLRYFRWSNLAVMAGMLVATAVLTGAMMVGDSVRHSLRTLALQRLGPVDHALVATRFFEASLADRIAKHAEFSNHFSAIYPAVIVKGGAATGDVATTTRTAGVQLAALGGPWVPVSPDKSIINRELARSLDVKSPGGTILLSIPIAQDGPRDAALAQNGRNEVQASLRTTSGAIADAPGMQSMFNLAGGQRLPRNAWLNLSDLQEAVGQQGALTLLLAQDKSDASQGSSPTSDAALLNSWLHDVATLEDYGLSITPSADKSQAVLSSRDTYLLRPIEDAADRAAAQTKTTLRRVSSYMVNTATVVSGAPASAPSASAESIHYAMIAGISDLEDKPLAADEIALNQWAADHLAAKPGDRIRLEFYHREPNGDLREEASDAPRLQMLFRVARILPMTGIGADPTLTPPYKGMTDADSVRDWHAPPGITIKKEWVTPDDEKYWKEHKAAPKLFVSMEAAHKLWGGPFGEITSIRVPAAQAKTFAENLRAQIDPAAMGMAFRPIKAEQLAATAGSTDFADLFIAFSFFLIVAAILLVAMLFRLNIEQRARQLGLLAAIGFRPRALRWMALKEGLILAIIGAALGLAGAIAYTALMMAGLRTWWFDAVGTTSMHLHIVPVTLITGFVTSIIIAALAILWGIWRIGRTPSARLLAGAWGSAAPEMRTRGRWPARFGWLALGLAIAMLASGLAKLMSPQEAFLGGGTLLLLASLTLLGSRLRPKRATGLSESIASLGFRNASRHTARSVLTMGLIAFATFLLVVVAANRGDARQNTDDPKSGAGGYRLMLQADIPLLGDLNTAKGRAVLGVTNPTAPIWSTAKFTPMRRWAGEDISCLNLTRPGSPTILSVPQAMVDRNAFTFARSIKSIDNLWKLLQDRDIAKDGVPVVADDETATYILHLSLGQSIDVTDQTGAKRKLTLVGTLSGSIFQGQLLMAEERFLELFPSQSGAGVVMIDVAAGDADALSRELGSELGDFAVTIDRTADVLTMYHNVQKTYLSTFQVLGSLGLLLGTIGLAVVLLRGLVERKAELAMLAAIGFRRLDRLRLVLTENVMLLLLGLGVGASCAIIAMLPALLQSGRQVHVMQLLLALLGILATGLLALVLAVWFGARRVAPADLRSE